MQSQQREGLDATPIMTEYQKTRVQSKSCALTAKNRLEICKRTPGGIVILSYCAHSNLKVWVPP